MKEPDHKAKRHIVPLSNKQKPYWIENPIHGWLGSGITDCNGVEIYEGDRVRFGDRDYPVEFRNGALTVDGTPLVMYSNGDDLEIIGHIATEARP